MASSSSSFVSATSRCHGQRIDNHIIELPITIEQHQRAEAREADMEARLVERYGRAYLNDSISAGHGTYCGLLSEEVVYDFYGQQWARSCGNDIFDWDLRDAVLGRIDVKGKKQDYPKPPRPHYHATVCAANTRQQCDWYCFVRIASSADRAWLLGFLPKGLFFERATFGKKGAIDPTSHNGFTYKWDCWNVPIAQTFCPPATVAEFPQLLEQVRAKEGQ